MCVLRPGWWALLRSRQGGAASTPLPSAARPRHHVRTPPLPQDIALLDARRGCTMFRKVDVPILGRRPVAPIAAVTREQPRQGCSPAKQRLQDHQPRPGSSSSQTTRMPPFQTNQLPQASLKTCRGLCAATAATSRTSLAAVRTRAWHGGRPCTSHAHRIQAWVGCSACSGGLRVPAAWVTLGEMSCCFPCVRPGLAAPPAGTVVACRRGGEGGC